MNRRSDSGDSSNSLRDKIIGLGERSVRKSYYPQLRQQLEEVQESRSRLQERSEALLNMLEDLDEARKDLADSEARYRSLVENISDVIFSLSSDGTVLYASPVIRNLIGLTPEQVIGQPFRHLVHPDDQPALAGFESIPEGQTEQLELRMLAVDGVTHYVRASGRPLVVDGRAIGVTAVLSDITEAKQAEAELRQSEEKYSAAFWATPDMLGITRLRDGMVLEINEGAERMLGHTRAESVGKTTAELGIWINATDREQYYDRLRRFGVVRDFETSFCRKDGTLIDVIMSGRKFRLQGEDCALSVVRDITERKRAEVALRASEEKYRTLLQKIEAAVVVHGADTQILTCNSMAQEILGLSEDQLLGKKAIDPAWHFAREDGSVMPPEEYPVAQVVATGQALENYVVGVHRPHEKASADVWTLVNADPVFDAAGQLEQVIVTFIDITALKVAEQALRESEQRYRDIFDYATDAMFLLQVTDDLRFRTIDVNPAFEVSTGTTREQVVGKLQEELTPPEQAEAVNVPYRRAVEGGVPVQGEIELELPAGRRYYLTSLIPLRDESGHIDRLLGISRDITESKVAEQALATSERKLALHLQQTLLGVLEWDTEFRVREWNPAAEAIFGYTRDEAIGHTVLELAIPPDRQTEMRPFFEHLLRREGGEFNTNENITKDGRIITCEWVNTPLVDSSGTVVGVMSLARDITERLQAEEFRIAKQAAEAASVAKSAFLANMSHEIRTPMNAILGFSQLMRHDKGLTERQRQQLDIINSSGEHLLALVNDVLEMAKIEAGRISANLTAFDLHALLDELESLFGLRAQTKGLALRVTRSDQVPRFAITDENKLRQVFVNLLGNAVKFTDEGSVELRVDVGPDEQGQLRLTAEVQDTGRGITQEDMGQLFNYFEQASVIHEAETGTGLGLAISREFVRLLGGEIEVESELGVGSTFKFDIVIEEATSQAAVAGPAESRVVGLEPGQPRYRVLVADDAPDNRELLVQLLERVGFAVRAVPDGKQALAVFEEWRPQMILMDMRMPVMDGYEATRRIRASSVGSDVAIIGVTASAFAEMRQGVFDAGVDEFVLKPFQENELFDKMAALLGARYIYETQDREAESQAAGALDPTVVAKLPAGLLARIRDAAVIADFDEIIELTGEVAGHDDDAAVALRTLAERFDAERILAALPKGSQ